MIHWLYERALLRGIDILPAHLCFMITESDMESSPCKLNEVTGWCLLVNDYLAAKNIRQSGGGDTHPPSIKGLTIHIRTPDPVRLYPYLAMIRKVGDHARLHLHIGDIEEITGAGMEVCVAVGKSGREEIVSCIRRMAEDRISPETLCEQTFEHYLTFPYAPDLVVKTGGSHLTDFLIWQSVYSELFFSDVNWKWFRKVDFLRALRDYQARVRRFGK
jgi:undecaprenyl diphosphate synthase